MSGSLKRYFPQRDAQGREAKIEEHPHGYLVAFRDYETVVRDNDGLRAELNFARDDIRDLAAEIDQLCALLDEAQRDAARYKWLRDVWWLGEYFDTPDPVTQANSAEEFDAAIDEARILRAGETK